ncbi:MAG TPA: ATP-binding protein [Chloroflexia bacterium]|jgi:DNA polymerase III delta prime subunit
MSAPESNNWQETNEHYLEVALDWLKLRLKQYTPVVAQPLVMAARAPEPGPAKPLPRRSLRFWTRQPEQGSSHVAGAGDAVSTQPPYLLSAPTIITEEHVRHLEEELAAAEQSPDPPALVRLARKFSLSPFEQDLLLLCAGVELSSEIAHLCSHFNGDPNKTYATFSMALAVLREPRWQALSPDSNLRYWQLIEIYQPGAQPLTTSALRADERIVSYIVGLEALDDRLALLMKPVNMNAGQVRLPRSQWDTVTAIGSHLAHAVETERAGVGGGVPVIQLVGADTRSKEMVAWRAISDQEDLELQLYSMQAEAIPAQASELETFSRLWDRECRLQNVALYLDASEVEQTSSTDRPGPPIAAFLSRTEGLIFLDTREVRPDLGRTSVTIDVERPTPVEQRDAWAAVLGEDAGDSPALLAGQFNLDLATIEQIAEVAGPEPGYPGPGLHERLWDACLARTRPHIEARARRIHVKASWEDLVLPEEDKRLLRQIIEHVRYRHRVYYDWGFGDKMNRGLGISVLFAGESGTGKTMAAEVIANELNLDLYQIDLSGVVNKYIGETEKNLRQLFDAAEGGGAILCFNEADALFGKRSEVKDSHDRYANITVGYLLQRMEDYNGLAILTTNMKNALDPAFLRRLRFTLDFRFPDRDLREQIWKKVFPGKMPTQLVVTAAAPGPNQADGGQNKSGSKKDEVVGLDYARLASFNLAGANISSVALNAAFLAASKGQSAVTMDCVLDAIKVEYRKLNRSTNSSDFDWKPPPAPGTTASMAGPTAGATPITSATATAVAPNGVPAVAESEETAGTKVTA